MVSTPATMYLLSRPGTPGVAAGWRLGLWVFPVFMGCLLFGGFVAFCVLGR